MAPWHRRSDADRALIEAVARRALAVAAERLAARDDAARPDAPERYEPSARLETVLDARTDAASKRPKSN